MDKKYTSGNTTITKGDFECLPLPLNTDGVTDEQMQEIADCVEREMKPWYDWRKDGLVTEDEVADKRDELMETFALAYMTYRAEE